MPKMISKTLPEYAGKKLKAGDHFEAEAGHVTLLELLECAELAQPVDKKDDNSAPPMQGPPLAVAASSKRGTNQGAARSNRMA